MLLVNYKRFEVEKSEEKKVITKADIESLKAKAIYTESLVELTRRLAVIMGELKQTLKENREFCRQQVEEIKAIREREGFEWEDK